MKNNILEYTIEDYKEDVQYLEGFGMTQREAEKFINLLLKMTPCEEVKSKLITYQLKKPCHELTQKEMYKILSA